MLIEAGTAIKERGIIWEETYGDKSLYLKKSFEEQVGPGSYFRWEGHDSTTGEDYYVVVTPGFSKKKGFHFFAALRKMPAKNGASGKKFRTQAEALSYAYDTWRVPPPKTKPHKPYIANDLKGKAIVMENVHSSIFPRTMKIGKKIVIDTSLPDTTAMAVMSSGPVGIIDNTKIPPTIGASVAKSNAMMSLALGPAAAFTDQRFHVIDTANQGVGSFVNTQTGRKERSIYNGISNPSPPSEKQWDNIMSQEGIPVANPLFELDSTGQLAPLSSVEGFGKYLRGKLPGSRGITFEKIMVVHPPAFVAYNKFAAFQTYVTEKNRTLKSKFVNTPEPISVTILSDPTKNAKGPSRDNYSVNISIPVDLVAPFANDLGTLANMDLPSLNWADMNAVKLYQAFDKAQMLKNPEDVESAKKQEVLEFASLSRGQLVLFNKHTLKPYGIKVKKNLRFKEETADQPKEDQDVVWPFARGVVEGWLARPEVGGSAEKLRHLLTTNQIEIKREDCRESLTCAPLTRNVVDKYNIVENGVQQATPEGEFVQVERPWITPAQRPTVKNQARQYNQETRQDEIVPLSANFNPNQMVTGLPASARDEDLSHFIPLAPIAGKPQEYHTITGGDTFLYDTESQGKFKDGAEYEIFIAPYLSHTRSQSGRKHFVEKGQAVSGWAIYTRKKTTDVVWEENNQRKGKNRQNIIRGTVGTVADIPEKYIKNLMTIRLDTGDEIEVPSEKANQVLANPNQKVSHYSFSQIRTHESVPFREPSSKKDRTVSQDWMVVENGEYRAKTDAQGQPVPPLRIPPDRLSVIPKGNGNVLIFKHLKDAAQLVQAKFNYDIGVYPDATSEDLLAAIDRARDVEEKVKNGLPLEEDEKPYAAVIQSGNVKTAPPEAIKLLSGLDPYNPELFTTKKGTLYVVREVGTNPDLSTYPNIFAGKLAAEDMKKELEQNGKAVEVVEVKNADLAVSAFRAAQSGNPKQTLLTNTGFEEVTEEEITNAVPIEEPEEPELAIPEPEIPGAEVAVPEPMPQTESPTPPQETVPITPQTPVAEEVVEPETVQIVPGLSSQPEIKKKPVLQPQPNLASTLDKLVKLANMLDEQGKTQEADAVDRIIKQTTEKFKNI